MLCGLASFQEVKVDARDVTQPDTVEYFRFLDRPGGKRLILPAGDGTLLQSSASFRCTPSKESGRSPEIQESEWWLWVVVEYRGDDGSIGLETCYVVRGEWLAVFHSRCLSSFFSSATSP